MLNYDQAVSPNYTWPDPGACNQLPTRVIFLPFLGSPAVLAHRLRGLWLPACPGRQVAPAGSHLAHGICASVH